MPRLQYDLDKIEEMTQYAEGTFRARLKSCVAAISDNSGNPMLVWTWTFLEGPNKGQTAKSWTSKMENALFGIKMHLTAFGYSGKVDMNTDRLIGKEVRLVMASRKGKNRSGEDTNYVSVVGLLPAKRGARDDYDEDYEEEEFDDEEEEDEAPPARRRPAATRNRRQVEEEDEEEDEEDEDERPRARRNGTNGRVRTIERSRRRIEPEDDEEEEDEEPPRRKRPAARPVASARRNGASTRRRARDEDEDEDDDDEVPF